MFTCRADCQYLCLAAAAVNNESTSTAYEEKHFGKDYQVEANDPFRKAAPFELQQIRADADYEDTIGADHKGALFIVHKKSEVLRLAF